MPDKKIVINGARGLSGGHLVDLLSEGADVHAVDVKPLSQWVQLFPQAENRPSIPRGRGLDRTYRRIHDQLAVAVAA
jgi:nucleoside-diphosphate-sugar epimerase